MLLPVFPSQSFCSLFLHAMTDWSLMSWQTIRILLLVTVVHIHQGFFFCMFDCSIYASGRGVPSVFCGFEDLAAQICGGGNGKQKGLLTRRRPCRAAVVGCYYVIFLLLLTREATMSFLGTPCQYISVKIFVCHSFVHLVSISVNTTVTGLLHNGPVRLFPLLRSP